MNPSCIERANARNRTLRAAVPAAVLAITTALAGCAGSHASPDRDSIGRSAPVVGPPSGALVLAGGGELDPEIWERFVEMAGGEESRIVVIPTAGTDESFPEGWPGLEPLRVAGAGSITILHTRDPAEANLRSFVDPLRSATGVWIPGGRQWRLVDAYLGTRVHTELFRLLERGGVIGGTSAGASIQASFLVRGAPESNQVMIAEGYEDGFALLPQAAVDQHLIARGRENDLWEVVDLHPDLLGIGLDEGTALVVRGNQAEVIGRSKVYIYDAASPARMPRVLERGSIFDLADRAVLSAVAPDASDRLP